MSEKVLVDAVVLGGAARVLEAIGLNDLELTLKRVGEGHPYSPLAQELLRAAIRHVQEHHGKVRDNLGRLGGYRRPFKNRIYAELASRPTVHLDIGCEGSVLLETGHRLADAPAKEGA